MTEEETSAVADIIVQMNSTDMHGNKTTPELVDGIAWRLTRHTETLMKKYYNPTKKYAFDTKIDQNSLRFKIIDIPTNIVEDYLLELDSAIENLDYWMDGMEYYASQKIIANAYIDENSPKVRKMEAKLPEIEGIF